MSLAKARTWEAHSRVSRAQIDDALLSPYIYQVSDGQVRTLGRVSSAPDGGFDRS